MSNAYIWLLELYGESHLFILTMCLWWITSFHDLKIPHLRTSLWVRKKAWPAYLKEGLLASNRPANAKHTFAVWKKKQTSCRKQGSQAMRLSDIPSILLWPLKTYITKYLKVQPPTSCGHTVGAIGDRRETGEHVKERCQLCVDKCSHWVMRT